jgi:hypothetical protein
MLVMCCECQAFDHAACLAEYSAAVNARIDKYLAESKAASGSGGGGGGRVRSAGQSFVRAELGVCCGR